MQRSSEQQFNLQSIYQCCCELSELVHQSLYSLYSPGRPFTATDLSSIYARYMAWYGQVPEMLELGANFTPATLFVQYVSILKFRKSSD